MTSQIETTKTNEFVRRRKLRLQQVREQSKDIAKKIRQRASYEQIQQAASLDGHKERIYLKHQENLINHLEKLYRNGIQNVGASHKKASDVNLQQEKAAKKQDPSKLRGKEAIAELRKKKQEKLDEQKEFLDKKLLARETANELSREKSSTVAIKLSKANEAVTGPPNNLDKPIENKLPVTKSDMATQWDTENHPNEWEPVPTLDLPNDYQEAEKTTIDNPIQLPKRLDLFAISDEMPSSLRGGLTQTSEARPSVRPALFMVSEYLQNRDLRLRQPDTVSRKSEEDLHRVKQTILRSRSSKTEVKSSGASIPSKTDIPTSVSEKVSVTMYNHLTRDSRDIPFNEEAVVVRDSVDDENAYSQALRETASNQKKDKEQQKRLHIMRSKIAMTKQSVDKEYKDTMAFLNSLDANKQKPIKAAYMDEEQHQARKERCQNKLQQEFKKIERECRSASCKNSKINKSRCKTAAAPDGDTDFVARDFQYSWMPVPESDGNLAIHTIPTAVKEAKSGNTVKFSKVDSYHEYRSRHKHTPPTKDTTCKKKLSKKREINNESYDSSQSSITSDTSSVENLSVKEKSERKKKILSDAEKIIIYKILDSGNEKNLKENSKLLSEIAKSLSSIHKKNSNSECNDAMQNKGAAPSLENVAEGIYKTAPALNGDNIASLSIPVEVQNIDSNVHVQKGLGKNGCDENKPDCKDDTVTTHNATVKKSAPPRHELYKTESTQVLPVSQPSAATSASSFITATDKQIKAPVDGGYIKLIGDDGEDAGKFYIGASGLLKDDAYEVVIQVRKKDAPRNADNQVNKHETKTPITNAAQTATVDATQDGCAQTIDNLVCECQNTNSQAPLEVNDNSAQKTNENELPAAAAADTHNLIDKGVDTSFLENVNHCSRPVSTATSAFTQTTFCSPQQRPMLIHMSSSTSTAYMSPPEMILPPFLKKDYHIPYEPLEDHRTKAKKQRKTDDLSDCSSDLVPRMNVGSKTPPNSLRSTESSIWDIKKSRKRSHRLSSCVKCHKRKENKFAQTTKRIRKAESIMGPRSINYKEPNIDPIIQKYVNKLLQLNRDGLKTIDVVNQECSSVTTPGSSVIDVSTNFCQTEKNPEKTLSLELIKKIINQQLLDTLLKTRCIHNNDGVQRNPKYSLHKNKSVHKVKSLNISKHLFKTRSKQSTESRNTDTSKKGCSSSSTKEQISKTNQRFKSKTSPSPTNISSTILEQSKSNICMKEANLTDPHSVFKQNVIIVQADPPVQQLTTSNSSDYEILNTKKHSNYINLNALSQSSQTNAPEVNFTKVAKDKIHNMEKIADLKEKCTKRLSNLAKVLEEVRKNKSLAYSHFSTSDSTSDSDQKSDKSVSTKIKSVSPEVQELRESIMPEQNISTSDQFKNSNISKEFSENRSISPIAATPSIDVSNKKSSDSKIIRCQFSTLTDALECSNIKHRTKPPPALSRISLKNERDCIIPHELSTVMEVDSPMSVMSAQVNKNHRSTNKNNIEVDEEENRSRVDNMTTNNVTENQTSDEIIRQTNPDLLQKNMKSSKSKSVIFASSIDESKLQMMDLNEFNEIMLKPFISMNEFAKHCNIEALDEGSVLDDLIKDNQNNADFSSMHSDSSLPDVVAELLKRNVISEPFQFDKSSGSNVNSTSESTSIIALSRVRKEKKKTQNAETSDTMSLSSNADHLEKAFKKLGMGWASSTLKKTKERLALSSSSSTSSTTSLSQFKIKRFSQEPPVLVTDSLSSALSVSKRYMKDMAADDAKNAEQQTNLTNSMTVKEFLTKELANKITFSNQSDRNATEDEFVSLVETKLPDELRQSHQQSIESIRSGTNNRARTSTPVQILKSMTYHSSSSSNMSNGLFSNADELSSVKGTNSTRNQSNSDKDDLTIPNCSLRMNRGASDCSKSD